MLAATTGPTSGIASSSASDIARSLSSVWTRAAMISAIRVPTWRIVSPVRRRSSVRCLARLDRLDQVVGRLLAHPLQIGQRGRVEPVEVGEALDQFLVHELVDQLLAQAVDVHGVAVGVPADPFLELVGASRRRSSCSRNRPRRPTVRPARRSSGRSSGSGRPSRSPLRASASTRTTWGMISPAFWITTASPIRTSLRSSSSALCRLARLTVVPASSTGSRSATGVSLPVLPTWTRDPDQLRDRLLGLVLEGDRPARALAPRPQPLALVEVVDLDDQAVGLEVERVPLVAPALGVLDHLVDRVVARPCAG